MSRETINNPVMTYNYFKVVDTTKSDKIILAPLTEEEIEWNKASIEYNKKEIDRMLGEIEFARMCNYNMAHSLKKNGHIIEME